ncbi:MAG: hypothetical protein AABY75_05455 [Bacteroidota bacterium]
MARPIENVVAIKNVTGTTSVTAGTRSNHAHGLGTAITKYRVLPVALAKGDNDTNDSAEVTVVKTDATNIVVKSSGTSVPFNLILLLRGIDPKPVVSFSGD